MAVTDGYHPRAVAMVGGFGGTIRRATLIGSAAGVVAGIVLGQALPISLGGLTVMGIVLFVTVGVGTGVAMLAVPPKVRRAFEAYSWLGHRETVRFRRTTASPVPVGFEPVRDWLAANPVTPATAEARVELLVAIGQFGQARTEFAALPEPADDLGRLNRASLRTWGEVVETGEVDMAAFDALAATLPAGSDAALEATVVRALAETRMGILKGDPDPMRPLRDVRPTLGRAATTVVLQDLWLPFARLMGAFGLFIGAIATILRVAVGG